MYIIRTSKVTCYSPSISTAGLGLSVYHTKWSDFASSKDQNVQIPEAGMPAVLRSADFLVFDLTMRRGALCRSKFWRALEIWVRITQGHCKLQYLVGSIQVPIGVSGKYCPVLHLSEIS